MLNFCQCRITLLLFVFSLKSTVAQQPAFPIHLLRLNPFEKGIIQKYNSTPTEAMLSDQFFFSAQESLANLRVDKHITETKAKFAKHKVKTIANLRTLVNKFQNHCMAEYREFSSLQANFDSGIYNCLTGVTLLSMVLDTLDIPYKIMTTENHVFLITELNSHQVLIEITDKNNPVVDHKRGIEETLETYKASSPWGTVFQIGDQQNKTGLLALFYLNTALNKAKNNREQEALEHALKYLYFCYLSGNRPQPLIDWLILKRKASNSEFGELISYRELFFLP